MELPDLPTVNYPTRLSKQQAEFHARQKAEFQGGQGEITLTPLNSEPEIPTVKKKKKKRSELGPSNVEHPEQWVTIPEMVPRKVPQNWVNPALQGYDRVALRRPKPVIHPILAGGQAVPMPEAPPMWNLMMLYNH